MLGGVREEVVVCESASTLPPHPAPRPLGGGRGSPVWVRQANTIAESLISAPPPVDLALALALAACLQGGWMERLAGGPQKCE